MARWRCLLVALTVMVLVGCAAAAPNVGGEGADRGSPDAPVRTLNLLTRAEPATLAAKAPRGAGGESPGVSVDSAVRPFNAGLDILDARGDPRPYLAEAVPELNSDSWRVLPDGRMETSYRLKPNLTWHDGAPLTAEDFVFAWRLYTAPEFGLASLAPQSLMEAVIAPDARSLTIRWRQIYPQASVLGEGLPPLPRHILDPLLREEPEAFLGNAFWSSAYIGLGPYRLERWERGAFFQGVAFEAHVWGRPKIQRIAVRFSSDENTALANLRAGTVHLASDRSIRFEQAVILRTEWRTSEQGVTLLTPTMSRRTHVQVRPEYATPRSLMDVRVRKALAYAVDKEALNEGLFSGLGVMTDTLIRPTVPYYAEIDRVVAKYPFDQRRSEQLMAEAGYVRGPDGTLANATGEAFRVQVQNQSGGQPERETAIMMDTWKRAGFDTFPNILRPPASGDPELRAIFSGVQTASGGMGLEEMVNYVAGPEIPTQANRWRGSNRGGWSDPEFDRLYAIYNRTLDGGDRVRLLARMMAMVNEELPVIPLFMNFGVSAHLGSLVGPDPGAVDDTLLTWNIHEWELR